MAISSDAHRHPEEHGRAPSGGTLLRTPLQSSNAFSAFPISADMRWRPETHERGKPSLEALEPRAKSCYDDKRGGRVIKPNSLKVLGSWKYDERDWKTDCDQHEMAISTIIRR